MTQPDGTYAETLYEPLGRTLKAEEQTNPNSPHYGAAMRYVNDGLLDKDGQGRLRQVYEITPEPWLTQYSYDLLDDFTGYIDAQNNRKFIEYDGLGRQRFMNDPDRGHMHWDYDDAGNLVRTQDAKAQVIRYAYDGANRLQAEWYGADTQVPDVEYHYDLPAGPLTRGEFWPAPQARQIAQSILQSQGANPSQDLNGDGPIDAADLVKAAQTDANAAAVTAQNTAGQLAWVRDQSGEEHRSYDPRGRIAWTIKRIQEAPVGAASGRDSPPALRDFFTALDYDSLERITKRTYPDSSYVTYAYNPRGLLESIPNVVTRYDYNPAGENLLLALANGITTQYAYDNRLRLKRIHSVRQRDGIALQDLNYDYDAVSNINTITDGRTDAELDRIGTDLGIGPTEARKFRATQAFAYDNLYRLTRAASPQVWGTIEHAYDRIGNMTQKRTTLLQPDPLANLGLMQSGAGAAGTFNRVGRTSGDPPGPHAITATARAPGEGLHFSYDANGNITREQDSLLQWDSNDRLTALTNGSLQADYNYDYHGSRKTKQVTDHETGNQSPTYYIDEASEFRDGRWVKYVLAGLYRVARIDGLGTSFGPAAPGVFYRHDHLGSTQLSLGTGALVLEQMLSDPFGYPRVQELAKPEGRLADYEFTGKERDTESGLHYYESRYYGSSLGRFKSVDPLASRMEMNWALHPQRLNTYSYTSNRPLIAVDPSGLDVIFLNDSTASFPGTFRDHGHLALLVEDPAGGGWRYYSKDGPGRNAAALYKSFDEFYNSNDNKRGSRYDRAVRIATSREVDARINENASQIIDRPYNLYQKTDHRNGQNCADFVIDAAAGLIPGLRRIEHGRHSPNDYADPNKIYRSFVFDHAHQISEQYDHPRNFNTGGTFSNAKKPEPKHYEPLE